MTPTTPTATDYKRQQTLIAEAARRGFSLYRLADGKWLIQRWNLCKELDDDQLEPWLAQVEGMRP